MILAVDIGNTTIACGVCAGKKILAVHRMDTFSDKARLTREMGKLCGRIYRKYPSLREVVICASRLGRWPSRKKSYDVKWVLSLW